VSRTTHPFWGSIVRCDHGRLGRRGEGEPCQATFRTFSDPGVISDQIKAAAWSRDRVRVPKHMQKSGQDTRSRATRDLCPAHARPAARKAKAA